MSHTYVPAQGTAHAPAHASAQEPASAHPTAQASSDADAHTVELLLVWDWIRQSLRGKSQ
ncbi:hypothetical protein O181_028653, partial [Austropuccinia psidii MF-1]|nr:hypothetical protein [Austropuccinia psidii MF-1]